jgi:MFS family permease
MRKYQSLLALNISTFLMMLGVGLIVAMLPQRVIDLSGSNATVGWLASAFAVSFVLLQVPIGHLADRLGYRIFLALGYVLAGTTGLIYYWSPSHLCLFVGRFFQGLGEIPIWALAPALLAIHHRKHTGRAIGLYNASMHLGLTVGPLLGLFLGQLLAKNAAFLFFTFVCALGAIIVWIFIEEPHNKSETAIRLESGHRINACTDWSMAAILSGIFLYGAGYGVYITCIPGYLIVEKGYSPTAVSIFFTCYYLGISLSQILAGPLADTKGHRGFMIAGLLGCGACLVIFPNISYPWTTVLLAVGSLGLGIFNVASMAFLSHRAPDSRQGAASGMYFFSWGLGYFGGPLGVGYLNQAFHGKAGFLVLASLIILNAVILTASSHKT